MATSTRTGFPFLPAALVCLAVAGVNSQNVARAADRSYNAQPSLKVSFGDLDLTSRQGTATLYFRIRNAARTVCGPVDRLLPDDWWGWTRCVNNAIADAVAKVGDANLTAYHRIRTNRSNTIVAPTSARASR
jgi:UrcA family protein